MDYLVECTTKNWIIAGLGTLIPIIILFFIIYLYLCKRKIFNLKLNKIINENLLKLEVNHYKFSERNAFILNNEIKWIVLDNRYKYFYKFKKRYKEGKLDNEIFEIVNKYYLKNEQELKKNSKTNNPNKTT